MQSPRSTPPLLDEHLSYPTFSTEPLPEASTSKAQPQSRQTLQDRLYIGNLHPTCRRVRSSPVNVAPLEHQHPHNRYALLQIFSKFGRVTKLDFLFHKTGLLKGKPRGYAFVEYGNKDDALKALSTAHDKLLRGRKLVVTFAQQAPFDPGAPSSYAGSKQRKIMAESGRPTTLSMLKSVGHRNDGTHDKIAMMEAKLRQMERSKPSSQAHDSSSSSSLPFNASLPPKPLPSNTPPSASQMARTPHEPQRQAQTASACQRCPCSHALRPPLRDRRCPPQRLHRRGKPGATPLLGVKLKKARDKEKEKKDVEGPAEGKSEEMVLG
ncbi:hypothetical protein C8J57DRAFT_1324156 [Mycena rebaudengoi]|nr:hypothetical protein C8J57DRAFT_1324156 [Mycena rebaudengoi]